MPGWATNAGGLLLVVLFQAALLAATAAAAHLNRRALPEIVPARDAHWFLHAPAAPEVEPQVGSQVGSQVEPQVEPRDGDAKWPADQRAA
jgi:polyisoprenyl-phosphate glycosyltransferase